MDINLNADCGESFGAWAMGNDPALLKIVGSANVACGFHASDPEVMVETVAACAREGVSIGAHPGFPDLQGFGRRQMDLSAAQVYAACLYQIGALQAVARGAGLQVTHVKAHGALSNMAMVRADYADAIARATLAADPALILLAIAGTELVTAGEKLGLKVAEEVFADRAYTDDGLLVSRKLPGAVIKGGQQSLDHVRRMIDKGGRVAQSGKVIPGNLHSICLHGDEPTAVEAAAIVREGLLADGHQLVGLPQLF